MRTMLELSNVVARAAAPYLECDAILVALLIMFPMIALYLPSLMN